MKRLSLYLALIFSAFSLTMADENDDLLKTMNPGPRPKYTIEVTKGGKTLGKIVIETFPGVAPQHCRNFDSLVAVKFYDGTKFHRVIADFMIQGGDPNSKTPNKNMWGMGDPTQTKVPAEFSTLKHFRGMVSAARSNDPNSATSQFFICHGNPTFLDGKYTIWGRAISGLDIVDKVATTPKEPSDRPLEDVVMTITKNTEEVAKTVVSEKSKKKEKSKTKKNEKSKTKKSK